MNNEGGAAMLDEAAVLRSGCRGRLDYGTMLVRA